MSDVFEKCSSWKDYKIAKATGLYPYFRVIEASHGATEVEIDGRRVIMVGSNNYLGLSADPRVKEAAIKAVEKFGSTCSGSRLLNGTLVLHEELEHKLAQFLNRDAAVVISTGFQTNLALASILGRHDIVFSDRGNHASLVDGIRLSFATERKFRHNDLEHLEQLLQAADPEAGKIIVTDGVFSMEGDICNLPRIVELAKKYNARVMTDDAHAMGVIGEHGRGTSEYFGLERETDLVMGTFSKSFASLGGVLAGPQDVITYIRHKARSVIFSASMTPASVAAALKSLEIIQAEPQRRARLLDIAEKMHNGFRAMGFDTGVSVTPVVPVLIGDQVKCFRFWRALHEAGVFANPVTAPAVEPGHALIRTSYMATHTDAQLDRVLDTFERIGKKMGVIPETRPTVYTPVQIARPGTAVLSNEASQRWAAASAGLLAERGFSLEQISRMSGREVAGKLFDAVETLTWRAANLQSEDLKRLSGTPLRLWEKRTELPGMLLEKGANLFIRNGKQAE
ncbi:aminotransferase class I/II-fold pyridoxal phosphate-dependent enzyme [Aggregicoccus sp. 17bor-14]|uniref:aminotransferase class I/II-fold pyridoxal phosphate-dependent enzyme n=1 Tax=Myxococcaceae TaxID=31 RepID=UPI00129CE409|nr:MULTISPECIES: aminotransferase class I/II-fold pyridoxal phosphate-dependent enzyme [Myxococcaceae]MBF5040855.1 aminotransferase class I/II-fold pyridoxal phosphate-dependent enzyme [Simulacricoccus sp. 17bor-14]MRI86644.1 aminotransferase class I/II-fold pyridoxal phosphate-dependent enzyme [Aggregicoccus sp. 17bor-14]